MSRRLLDITIHIISGYGWLNRHLKQAGLKEDCEYQFFQDSDETPDHLLRDCVAPMCIHANY